MDKIENEPEWTFTPERFPILGTVWSYLARHLADGQWHAFSDVVESAVADGANRDTVKNLIRDARRAGRIEQRGAWRPKTRTDSRIVRLAPRCS